MPAPGTVQLSQNITLSGVDGYKFKTLYVVMALAKTLNVTVDTMFAQVMSKRLSNALFVLMEED